MSDTTVKFEQAQEASDDRKREQSTIAFPYHDLDTAIEVATALYNRSGLGPCDLDELAAEMGQVIGGAFRVKLGAARTFDLVDKDGRACATLTDLGRRIVSGENARGARAEAFMAVPLYAAVYEKYKGQKLPPMKALEREMESLGVSSKQKDKARQVFERAARQAGYFDMGDDRLIRPKAEIADAQPDGDAQRRQHDNDTSRKEPDRKTGGGGGGDDSDGKNHPLIRGLLVTLPEPGTPWPKSERQAWLNMAASIFDMIYKEARPSRASDEDEDGDWIK